MLFSPIFATLAVFASAISAVVTPRSPTGQCETKLQRKAWHTLSVAEKKSYIDAELCLMKLPATLGLTGAKNRFEELQSAHQVQAAITHGVGAFLPFHRLHMYAHEQLLRNECGYKGAQPYWDETRDAGKFYKSDVLDPVTGFGGNGVGANGCIVDGPFANFTNNLGPGYRVGDSLNCINRFVNDAISVMAGQEYLDFCLKKKTYVDFWLCAENAPHRSGHGGVGGKMTDPIASPGDPIFYLHHTWLDKLFWQWQSLDLATRLTEMGGGNVQTGFGFDSMRPPPGAAPQLPAGDPANTTTLSHSLNMFGVIPNATIADVMDIRGALLCFEYI
ncbi:hypothetical protein B0T18DRAFT_450835 [Schizothecium vesticola]|uniref:Tyrosinase copper-binding domain-containing protein n=1 Tax=Schizothecium vesticola TaxID=314040 RepID=A0AA40F7V3_9PEZI|nr:hypothetical protein B0T18DRAFT_450835 [Schizothecium vesticola]